MPATPATPRWFTIVTILLCTPLLMLPWLLDAPCARQNGVSLWIKLYPAYVAVAAWLAWQCYPQRHALAWVLLILMAMSHCAIWILAFNGLQ